MAPLQTYSIVGLDYSPYGNEGYIVLTDAIVTVGGVLYGCHGWLDRPRRAYLSAVPAAMNVFAEIELQIGTGQRIAAMGRTAVQFYSHRLADLAAWRPGPHGAHYAAVDRALWREVRAAMPEES